MQIQGAGYAQEGCEIIDRFMSVQDFTVKDVYELRHILILIPRHLFQHIPELVFQPNAGDTTLDP